MDLPRESRGRGGRRPSTCAVRSSDLAVVLLRSSNPDVLVQISGAPCRRTAAMPSCRSPARTWRSAPTVKPDIERLRRTGSRSTPCSRTSSGVSAVRTDRVAPERTEIGERIQFVEQLAAIAQRLALIVHLGACHSSMLAAPGLALCEGDLCDLPGVGPGGVEIFRVIANHFARCRIRRWGGPTRSSSAPLFLAGLEREGTAIAPARLSPALTIGRSLFGSRPSFENGFQPGAVRGGEERGLIGDRDAGRLRRRQSPSARPTPRSESFGSATKRFP